MPNTDSGLGVECHLNKPKMCDTSLSVWEWRKQLAEAGALSLLSNSRIFDDTMCLKNQDCMSNYFVALREEVKNRILVFWVVID